MSETPPPSAVASTQEGVVKLRVETIDYAKGIGILLVVAAHVWRGAQGAGVHLPAALRADGSVDRWVYGFHMPLFFFASGLFLYRSAAKPAGAFVLDKCSTIVWPYLLWSTIYWQLGRFAGGGGSRMSPAAFGRALAVDPIGHLWFLAVLFLISITVLIARKAHASPFVLTSIALGLNAAARNAWILLPRVPFMYAIYLPYVAVGALLAPAIFGALSRWPMWRWCAILAISLALTILLRRPRGLSAEFGLYTPWAGIAMTLAASRLVERIGARPLQWLGVLSLQIYVAHIAFAALVRIVLAKAHLTGWPIELSAGIVVGIVGPILLWWIARRARLGILFRLPTDLLRWSGK